MRNEKDHTFINRIQEVIQKYKFEPVEKLMEQPTRNDICSHLLFHRVQMEEIFLLYLDFMFCSIYDCVTSLLFISPDLILIGSFPVSIRIFIGMSDVKQTSLRKNHCSIYKYRMGLYQSHIIYGRVQEICISWYNPFLKLSRYFCIFWRCLSRVLFRLEQTNKKWYMFSSPVSQSVQALDGLYKSRNKLWNSY
jgi:hypothetical protein